MNNNYYQFSKKLLYPLNRSITGKDTLKTLKLIKSLFKNLKIKSIKSNSRVFDWIIPDEWNISDAYIEDKYKKKIIQFKKNNLHLVGYSSPVNIKMNKKELLQKIFFLKSQPNAIPYVTSYYKRDWGFCASYNQVQNIKKIYKNNDIFKIIINSKFNSKGKLNYGEFILKGESKKEILISTYI